MDNKTYTLDSNHKQNKSNEIDLIKLFVNVWYKRKFIMIFTSVFVLFGIFVAITSPVSYTTSVTVVPQMGNKGGAGSIGSLASMMGVNVGSSMSSETLSPYIYPQIINSVPFCKEIMETPIVVEKSNGKPISLYDYYTDKQYSGTNLLDVVRKYTIGLPFMLISALRSDDELIVTSDTIIDQVLTISKNEREVIEVIRKNIQFSSNDKEGYVMLGYSFSEPEPTAVIAQNMYATLEKYVKDYKSQKHLDNLAFVEESYERVRQDFMEKQATLAAFQDANRDLTSAMARSTERRLRSEYDVAYTVYNELARQLEQAKIAVNESTPVLIVIDPVVVPYKKSAPKRVFILFIFMFFGVFFSVGWIIIKPFFQEVFTSVKTNEQSLISDEELTV